MKKLNFYFLILIILFNLNSTEEKLQKLNKLYMLYDLSNNLQKQIEVINEVKKLDKEIYSLLMAKYFLKLKKYPEANAHLKEIKNKNNKNELLLLKLKIYENENTEEETYINDLSRNIKDLDVKILYQLYYMFKTKNKELSLKVKNIILKDYPKTIYSYKILNNE